MVSLTGILETLRGILNVQQKATRSFRIPTFIFTSLPSPTTPTAIYHHKNNIINMNRILISSTLMLTEISFPLSIHGYLPHRHHNASSSIVLYLVEEGSRRGNSYTTDLKNEFKYIFCLFYLFLWIPLQFSFHLIQIQKV